MSKTKVQFKNIFTNTPEGDGGKSSYRLWILKQQSNLLTVNHGDILFNLSVTRVFKTLETFRHLGT